MFVDGCRGRRAAFCFRILLQTAAPRRPRQALERFTTRGDKPSCGAFVRRSSPAPLRSRFSATASAQFTNTYVFGDSLSDAGQYGARFTTNPGLVTPMYVGQYYGITVDAIVYRRARLRAGRRARQFAVAARPARRAGLFDRAAGEPAAREGLPGSARALPDPGRRQRHLRAGEPVPRRPDHAVAIAGRRRAGRASISQRRSSSSRAAGAQYIVLQQLPDIGKTPRARGGSARRRLFTALSQPVQHARSTRRSRVRRAGDPVQHVRAAERDHRQPGAVRLRQLDPAGVHDGELAAMHAEHARRAEREHELRLRRRRASDHRRRSPAHAGDRLDDHRAAADGGARARRRSTSSAPTGARSTAA